MSSDTVPELNPRIFDCWYCEASTQHQWPEVILHGYTRNPLSASVCVVCNNLTVWHEKEMIYPACIADASPNADLDTSIQDDFMEAAEILTKSPRSAAALLRLCLQKLCIQLGERGKNIEDDIASLVQKGLDERIQKALEIVRVIGNDAVVPGSIVQSDSAEIAEELFQLVNIIADHMLTRPKEIDAFCKTLPADKLKNIEERDEKALFSGRLPRTERTVNGANQDYMREEGSVK